MPSHTLLIPLSLPPQLRKIRKENPFLSSRVQILPILGHRLLILSMTLNSLSSRQNVFLLERPKLGVYISTVLSPPTRLSPTHPQPSSSSSGSVTLALYLTCFSSLAASLYPFIDLLDLVHISRSTILLWKFVKRTRRQNL